MNIFLIGAGSQTCDSQLIPVGLAPDMPGKQLILPGEATASQAFVALAKENVLHGNDGSHLDEWLSM